MKELEVRKKVKVNKKRQEREKVLEEERKNNEKIENKSINKLQLENGNFYKSKHSMEKRSETKKKK